MDGSKQQAEAPWSSCVDSLMSSLDETEVARVLHSLSSTLREPIDKLKILNDGPLEGKVSISHAVLYQHWKLWKLHKANEVPEVALLLKIIIAQQLGYEELEQEIKKMRSELEARRRDQLTYYKDARLAVQTLDRVKAALNGNCDRTESFWDSMQI